MPVAQVVSLVIAVWSAAVVMLGALGAFVGSPGAVPVAILAAFSIPIAAFLATYRASQAFRSFVLSLDLRVLAGMQAWQLGGFWFLALYTYGLLPGLFAWPAGIGDATVALAAPWVILNLLRDPAFVRSRRFVLWNLFGILDLVVAVTLGGLSSGVVPGLTGSVTSAIMAQLPLVLVPAFFVPLLITLHLAALFQARRAHPGSRGRLAGAGAVPA